MTDIRQKIIEELLSDLRQKIEFNEEIISDLSEALKSKTKLKPSTIEEILTRESAEEAHDSN